MQRILVVSIVVLVTGCSWLAMTPPPSHDPRVRPVGCTESKRVPAADTLGAVTIALTGVVLLWAFHADGNPPQTNDILKVEATLLAGVGVLGFSARTGFIWANECRVLNASRLPPQQPALPAARR